MINNSSLAQIKWEQMMFLGHPEYGCDLQPVNFAAAPKGLACAVADGNEPMLPPKRREEYVKKLQKALDQGTPARADIERALSEQPARLSLRD